MSPDTNGTVLAGHAVLTLYGMVSFVLLFVFLYLTLGSRAKSKRPLSAFLYRSTFKPSMRDDDDFRIQVVVFFWVFATVMAGLTSALLFSGYAGITVSTQLGRSTVISAASVLLSAFGITFTFAMRSEQGTRNARQQLYQALEIQSIDLFRYETGSPELLRNLWFAPDGTSPPAEAPNGTLTPTDEVARYQIRQYICQLLNLFEMAVRFQIQGVFPRDVFGSWVIWMWELCKSPAFHRAWLHPDNLPFNYISELRGIMTAGVAIAKKGRLSGDEESIQRERFFDAVSRELESPEIRRWFYQTLDNKLLFILKNE